MNQQLQNWDNFCQYHLGEWHGINTRYSPEGKVIDSWQIVTNLQMSQDGNKIYHQDSLTYKDGKKELKNFGSYTKPITSALFLNNSFCWGTKKIDSGSIFIFEIGLRFEDKRVLAFTKYTNSGSLEYIAISPQLLGSDFSEAIKTSVENQVSQNWRGKFKAIKPDLTLLEPGEISWKPLKDLNQNYLTLNFQDNISVSCPQNIEKEKEFFIAVDWLANCDLLQRGVGYYDAFGFNHFTLQIFTPSS